MAAALLAIALGMANYIALLRLKPEVSAIAWIADKPDYESHLVNINQRALSRARGAPDSFLPIYDVQNPGFFLLVAELYARAGAVTPLPLEISSIVLFNLGALFFFGWVYLLFSSLITAAFATAFLALSQFFLFFPGVTHTMPYEFVFFNLTLLLYLGFLRSGYRAYFFGALFAMFLTCMNYWFYYMSSWIIMVGLWWQYRGRPAIGDIAAISAPPMAALVFTAGMVMALFGIWPGTMRLLDILVARTFDVRIPGGHWYPDQHFMDAQAWAAYPDTVMYRLQWAYSIDTFWFMAAAGCTFVLLGFRDRRALVSALILLLGGTSWYYVMFQHTHIHHFVGQYSFMAICPIFGLIVSEALGSIWRAGGALASVQGSRAEAPPSSQRWQRVVLNMAVAAIMAGVGWKMIYPFAIRTYGLIHETVRLSTIVEARYQQAVQSICRDKGEVTLPDLQAASKDWGIEWRPSAIANTNRLPRCAG
ncbi:hypothetical protein A1D31_34015 [Bradyrhizobium liaoningense]|nr:hypothetical protein A1D31_34015 [Bradyrhizobium liaoningense]